jgi:membrane protease YdiL (CAAX protease family)
MLATLAIAALALYLLVAEPLLGRRSHRRLLAALDAGEADARRRFYLQWTWQGWALMLATLLVTLGIAGWTPAQLGLQLPHWPTGWSDDASRGLLAGFVVGVVLAAVAGYVIRRVMARRGKGTTAARTPRLAGGDHVLRMLPHDQAERRGFIALAFTAGVTEEVIWRGFGLGLLFVLLPHAPVALPIALAALAFGWAHFYQGWSGVLATAFIGALLAWLYWATGSLLPPMLLHVLIDLRAAFVRVPVSSNP